MTCIRWKPKNQDPIREFFGVDSPTFGLSLLPSFEQTSYGTRSWYPALDVVEEKDHVIIKADLPGLKKEDINISVEGSLVTIKGERKIEKEEKGKNYHRVERSYGIFERSLDLGTAVDESNIKAIYKEGVLEISLPKIERKGKQINIE